MNKKTRNIAFSIIVLVGLAAIFYIHQSYGVQPQAQSANKSETVKSTKVTLEGKVVAEKSADLGFVLPASIKSITKKVGDRVKVGEILATQDNSDVQAQLSGAVASGSSAQAIADQMNNTLKAQKLKLNDVKGNDKKIQKAEVAGVENGIIAQQNAVKAAFDNVKNAQAQLAKTVLRSPFDGVITRQDGEVGEVGGFGVSPFITIESDSANMKIEVTATELDIAKIKVGDKAQVTFDALGAADSMDAHISMIDPMTTNGVYKVTLLLDKSGESITSGMHANVTME